MLNSRICAVLLAATSICTSLSAIVPIPAQAQYSQEQANQYNAILKEYAGTLQAGQNSLQQNQPDKALTYLKQSEVIARRLPGKFGLQKRVESLKLCATLCQEMGRHGQADEFRKQALYIISNTFQPTGNPVIDCNKQAGMLKRQGKYQESEAKYLQALAALSPRQKDGLDAACIHDNLGVLYSDEKQYDKAIAQHTLALTLYRKLAGENDKDTAYCEGNLGSAYLCKKDYAKAEPLLVAARKTIEKAEGSQGAAMGLILDNLGVLYSRVNKLTEAEDIQKRALVLIEKTHGHFSADTATTLNNLATTYCLEGKYSDSRRLATEALGIATKVLGPDHPKTRTIATDLKGIDVYESKNGTATSKPQAGPGNSSQPSPEKGPDKEALTKPEQNSSGKTEPIADAKTDARTDKEPEAKPESPPSQSN